MQLIVVFRGHHEDRNSYSKAVVLCGVCTCVFARGASSSWSVRVETSVINLDRTVAFVQM